MLTYLIYHFYENCSSICAELSINNRVNSQLSWISSQKCHRSKYIVGKVFLYFPDLNTKFSQNWREDI